LSRAAGTEGLFASKARTSRYRRRPSLARRASAVRRSHQAGQGIVEYGLILAIMVVVCIVALVFFGDQLAAILGFIASKV
jgi:Flp pilus assembly pilin Flp